MNYLFSLQQKKCTDITRKKLHYQEMQYDKRVCSLNRTKSVDKAVARTGRSSKTSISSLQQ